MVTRHDLFRVDWLPGRLVLNTRIPTRTVHTGRRKLHIAKLIIKRRSTVKNHFTQWLKYLGTQGNGY